MDLLWKVSARAKEMLAQREEMAKNQAAAASESEQTALLTTAQSETENSTAPAAAAAAPEPQDRPTEPKVEQPPQQEQPAPDACSEKSSSPEYDEGETNVKRKDSERNLISGLGSTDIKDVSLKAVEGAKSIGGFLFGVANRTGRSISETAKQLKQTVEQNSILAELNKEQEAFVTNKAAKTSDAGLPPWAGCEDEENVKQQILSLSADKRNFLRNPPSGVMFEFSFDAMYPVAMVMLKEDPQLEKMRFELVPKLVTEENFWRNYFYRVSLLKQSTRLSSMAQKSSSGESSTWSSKKSFSDESSKEAKSHLSKIHDSGAQEFASDDYQSSQMSAEDIKHGMKMLGVTSKTSKEDEWEKELQQELQEYEVVSGGAGDDERAWEHEIDNIIGKERVKDIV